MNTRTSDDKNIQIILDKLKSKQPGIYLKLFGSFNSNNSDSSNDIVKKRRMALISHGNEALRILKSQRANLGKKDSPCIRAALVIDYLVRNVHNECWYFRSSIPISTLMEIIGLKKLPKQELGQMQTLLGSYLRGTAIAAKIANSNKNIRIPKKSNAGGAAVPSSTTHSGLIRDLCITLGPLIPDAEFVFKYATKLFVALGNGTSSGSSSRNSRQEQQSLRKDMERCLEYYEGACFYLAVKECEGANYNDVLKKKASSKMIMKNQKREEEVTDDAGWRSEVRGNGDKDEKNNEGDDDDSDDDRPMNEMDVVMAACLSENTFKTVLDYVKKHAKDIVISLDDITDQKKPAKKKKGNAEKGTSCVANEYGGQSVIVENCVNSGWQSMSCQSGNYSEFELWKRKVLDSTFAKIQQQRKECGESNMSREETLKCAAKEVVEALQKIS
jgi:hypothetical protein